MVDKYEQRRLRVIQLKQERCNDNTAELARRINRDPSYVARMLYPEGKAGKKRIAEDMVGIIEQAFSLPPGWLDASSATTNAKHGAAVHGEIPVLSLKQAPLIAGEEAIQAHHYQQTIPCPVPASADAFAFTVEGISMEPRFLAGDIVICDRKITLTHGRYVIANQAGGDMLFRQYVEEGSRGFLRAVNPAWPEPLISINDHWTIHAVALCKVEMV